MGGCQLQVYDIVTYSDMKRDLDLVRKILLAVEADPRFDGRRLLAPDICSDVGISGRPIQEISYHLELLIKEGFLEGNAGPLRPTISKLTWKGHEFLDDIRDDSIWAKAKQRVSGLQSVAFSVLAEIAKAEIKKQLGLS